MDVTVYNTVCAERIELQSETVVGVDGWVLFVSDTVEVFGQQGLVKEPFCYPGRKNTRKS